MIYEPSLQGGIELFQVEKEGKDVTWRSNSMCKEIEVGKHGELGSGMVLQTS